MYNKQRILEFYLLERIYTMKHAKTKRFLSALLAMLMTIGVLVGAVSCAEAGDDPATESTGATGNGQESSDVTSEEETVPAYSTVEKQKFNRAFTILTREDLEEDMYIESITSNVLDDAIYARNVAITDDFDVTIECLTENDYNVINTKMANQVNGGLDEYDLYVGHKYSFGACAQNNYCYNLNNINTLNLEGEWWDQNCYDNLTIEKKTYMMTGDINPSSMRISACMTFNKDLMKDLKKSPDELNALTKNGGWTLDVLYEYTSGVTSDKNGDGAIKYEDDQYGLVSWMMDVPFSMYYGSGKRFISIVDGAPELTFTTEEVTDVYSKIYKIIIENNAYFVTDVNVWTSCYDVFRDGRGLFCDITLGKITSYIVDAGGMDDAYGILPIPKYDTHQKEYLSFVNGSSAFVMVANTEEDLDFVGTIMEAMATYNYDKVTPNMFQVVTKLQAAQDPESAAMVDYIIRNRIYDLGYFYDFTISNVVLTNLKSQTDTISSALKSAGTAAKRELKKLTAAYEKCE